MTFQDNLAGVVLASLKITLDGQEINNYLNFSPGQVSYTPAVDLSLGDHTITVSGEDYAGNQATLARAQFRILEPQPSLPPDPVSVAPPLPETKLTNLQKATEFLYTGSNPIQTGMAPETIEAKRVAVLRGQVTTKEGNPLAGVAISVLGHPEYGQTLTRADGQFDLAVNGGGLLTLTYTKEGYFEVQRQIKAPWRDYAHLPEVALISADTKITTIDLNSNEVQVATSSLVTDADGSRQARLFFPPGTTAAGYNGGSLQIRATEYTVGENGPKAMPAALPPNTGYTYCVELTADDIERSYL